MVYINNEETAFKCFDNVHSIRKYEIYINYTLTFNIRYFAWCYQIFMNFACSFLILFKI